MAAEHPLSQLSKNPAAAPRRQRPWGKRLMHWQRRGHLFVGLFLIPWVLLYAITGFLLNHHAIWPEGEVRTLTREMIHSAGLETAIPEPANLALEVTALLNERAGSQQYQLSVPKTSAYGFPAFAIKGRSGDRELEGWIDPTAQRGYVDLIPVPPIPQPAPFAVEEGLFGKEKTGDRVALAAKELFQKLEAPADDAAASYLPSLNFTMTDADGQQWRASYDPQTGAVSGAKLDAPRPQLPLKELLYQIHFTAGYPESANWRTIWAVCVDATAIAMVFWCITGILMWWQIKSVRRWGFAVLAASVVCTFIAGYAMHEFHKL